MHSIIAVLVSIITTAGPVASEPVQVVATTGMIGDLVRAVGGEDVSVDVLVGPGIDPHLYKPTRSDIAKLRGADLVVANGLHLEGRMSDALDRARSAGRTVLVLGDAVPPGSLIRDEDTDEIDPHLWMAPLVWIETIDPVRKALTDLRPEQAKSFEQSAAEYRRTLEALDAYARGVLTSIPKSARVLVTAHDAFAYLGKTYGIEVVGIQGISTESEAGVRDIERIVELLVSRKIPAVFVESTVPSRSVEALVAGAKAKGQTVRIGGSLFSDAMGAQGTYEGTYTGMIDHNATTIARALGGTAPATGMTGKLAP